MKLKHLVLSLLFCVVSLFTSLAQQWGDYTLYSTLNAVTTKLRDTSGVLVHQWNHTNTYKTGYSTYMLPGGNIIRNVIYAGGNSFVGGPICGEVQTVDWNGNILWDFVYSTPNYVTHHDICPMPNGNVLMIAYERKTPAEVAAAGCTSFSAEMWPDKIVEVQPVGTNGGNIVWEWHAWDHLVQNTNAAAANYQTSILNHPELLDINWDTQQDWMHMNGISYNPILDQIAVSCHNLSEMLIIDHSTTTAEAASHSGGNSGKGGDLLYRWGNPTVYDINNGVQILNVVHDAHWIPEGVPNAGNLVGFDNNGISATISSVDQIITPINGYNYYLTSGQDYAPLSYSFRLACNGHTSSMGSSQQLPNGNQLVCMALTGLIYETDPAGNTIWSFTSTGSVPKAYRYDTCYINNPAPPIPLISENAGTLSSFPAVTYQWYLNGQPIIGAVSQTYTPAADGIYLVRITDTHGCIFQYSSGYHFTMTSVGIANQNNINSVSVFPNPSTGIVKVTANSFFGKICEIRVSDVYGKLLFNEKETLTIDLSKQPNGLYFIVITNDKGQAVTKKLSVFK